MTISDCSQDLVLVGAKKYLLERLLYLERMKLMSKRSEFQCVVIKRLENKKRDLQGLNRNLISAIYAPCTSYRADQRGISPQAKYFSTLKVQRISMTQI